MFAAWSKDPRAPVTPPERRHPREKPPRSEELVSMAERAIASTKAWPPRGKDGHHRSARPRPERPNTTFELAVVVLGLAVVRAKLMGIGSGVISRLQFSKPILREVGLAGEQ